MWWQVECLVRIEMREAGENNPSNRSHYSGPKQFGEPRYGGDAAVEQKRSEDADADRQQGCRHCYPRQLQRPKQRKIQAPGTRRPHMLDAREKEGRILGKPHSSRSDGQRSAERKLPDE